MAHHLTSPRWRERLSDKPADILLFADALSLSPMTFGMLVPLLISGAPSLSHSHWRKQITRKRKKKITREVCRPTDMGLPDPAWVSRPHDPVWPRPSRQLRLRRDLAANSTGNLSPTEYKITCLEKER
jgi:hypothetical protein